MQVLGLVQTTVTVHNGDNGRLYVRQNNGRLYWALDAVLDTRDKYFSVVHVSALAAMEI